MEHSYNRPGVYQNAVFFESSKEVFGISPLPHKLATDLGIDLAPNEEIHNDTKKQQTKYPILPVHTKEERDLFRDIVEEKYKDSRPDYMAFAKVWSKHVDEHLRIYYGQYIQLRNTAVSKEINITQRERIKEVLSDTSRKRLAPAAREPSQDKVPRYRQAHIPQLSSVATNILEITPSTPLSYNIIIWNQNAVSTPSTSPTAISLQHSPSLSNTPLDVDNNNNNNNNNSSQQQPQQLAVSSRGLRAAPESSQAPLFRVSNIVLPKYCGRNKRQ
ncbi:hypothetical protein BDC45DRAFT_540671 [Circinella umbellata]|nr:hypothetical protein BDC45DRAFT_540671 [Circinella umbellata]